MRFSPRRYTIVRHRPSGPVGGILSAWIAVTCLMLQLAAASACGIGAIPGVVGPIPVVADVGQNGSPFPICHAMAADEDLASEHGGRHPPSRQHACPFCVAHGHAAAALAASGAIVTPYATAVVLAAPPAIRPHRAARFAVGAPPRGPPAAV